MTRSRPIVSDRPLDEIWKLLRFFLDSERVSHQIADRHSLAPGNHRSNIRKQAVQLGQSIKQAQEYFEAARRVTLATRPTLLYYGAVSLSRALSLFRLDGSHSYDALRKAERHNHHGLDLRRDFVNVPVNADPTTFSQLVPDLLTRRFGWRCRVVVLHR